MKRLMPQSQLSCYRCQMPSTKGHCYFVGDIQGCLDELKALLAQVNFDPKLDTLYLTGDLVARGPKSLETLYFVRSLGDAAKTVLGNHDIHLMATYYGIKKVKANDKLGPLLDAPDIAELIDWLRQQPLLLEVDNCIMTHAGISPFWSIDKAKKLALEAESILRGDNYFAFLSNMYENTPDRWHDLLQDYERFRYIINSFTRMRFCHLDGSMEFTIKCAPDQADQRHITPWFTLKRKSWQQYTLVFGHWASLMGYTNDPEIIALDTGCVWGNHMTMWRSSDRRLFTTAANPI